MSYDATALFPTDVSYGSRGGPGYNTNVTEMDAGTEERVSRWNSPKHFYDVSYGIKTPTQLATVRKHFNARRGAAVGFPYLDPSDYASTSDGQIPVVGTAVVTNADQVIGTGTGSQTVFQLVKKYTSGASTTTRNITKPITGTVLIAVNAVSKTEGPDFTVDTLTGLVTFAVAPTAGHVITAGYQFYVPVRYGLDVDKALMISVDSFAEGSIDSIVLAEIVDGGGIEDEFAHRGAKEVSSAGTVSITTEAALWLITMTATSQHADLPNPTTQNLPTGGPYFFIGNAGANSFALKDHLGTTLVTLTTGTGVEVWLSKDGSNNFVWYALS